MTDAPGDRLDPLTDAGRRHLFGVAYRLLGTAQDAEDAAQETLIRWQALSDGDRAAIREPMAWSTRVIGRICLDLLGSARARRERYVGTWLPEPLPGTVLAADATLAGATDPADAISEAESVSLAILALLERLTPAERVALVLHDVFGLPFARIGEIVDRSPAACRQLATAARREVRGRPRFAVSGPERDRVVTAFADAFMGGDLVALMRVLAPDVVARSDGGGVVPAGSRPIRGAERVARLLVGLLRLPAAQDATVDWRLEPVNGLTGLVITLGGAVAAVVDVAVRDGQVAELATVVNPAKLDAWRV